MKKMMLASAIAVMGFASFVQTSEVRAAEAPAKYNMYCVACHSTGAAGAPKTGDKAVWEARLAGGMDAMVANAVTGKGAMPPKGLCADCSDADLKEIIEFMAK